MTIIVHSNMLDYNSRAELYIDISPSERIYFSDMEAGAYESAEKFAERVENRKAELAAALKKFVEQHK